MPSHLHMICKASEEQKLSDIIRDLNTHEQKDSWNNNQQTRKQARMASGGFSKSMWTSEKGSEIQSLAEWLSCWRN